MKPDSGKIKGIGNIKQILKRNKKNGSVVPVHAECAKRTFNVLALLFKNYFLSDTAALIQLVFPFLLTETSHQESILLILFQFCDNMSYPCKYMYTSYPCKRTL